MNMVWHQMSFDNFYAFITTQTSEYFSQTTSLLIIDDFSSILRGEDNVAEHSHFVCDKLCAFCAPQLLIFLVSAKIIHWIIFLLLSLYSRLEHLYCNAFGVFWYNRHRAPA